MRISSHLRHCHCTHHSMISLVIPVMPHFLKRKCVQLGIADSLKRHPAPSPTPRLLVLSDQKFPLSHWRNLGSYWGCQETQPLVSPKDPVKGINPRRVQPGFESKFMYEETPQENKRTLDFSATSRRTAELRRTNNLLEKGKEKHTKTWRGLVLQWELWCSPSDHEILLPIWVHAHSHLSSCRWNLCCDFGQGQDLRVGYIHEIKMLHVSHNKRLHQISYHHFRKVVNVGRYRQPEKNYILPA